jgi:hypothetical protein
MAVHDFVVFLEIRKKTNQLIFQKIGWDIKTFSLPIINFLRYLGYHSEESITMITMIGFLVTLYCA